VGKHRNNPRYFKGKQLQSEIFNQLNIKKSKINKDNFGKNKRKKKKKNGESWKKKVILEKKINEKKRGGKLKKKMKKKKKEECPVDYCCNPQCIGCG